MEWQLLDKNYDFKNEIQTSGYSDMLNDNNRNKKYYNALKDVISQMKRKNQKIHVLDIGCGSGILSMMALQLGADKVTACESFEPMYRCAKKILKINNLFSDKINLINCNSTDLKIGVNMCEKANILVSEIFDTELIGEGVFPTFHHALENLLTKNAIMIPFKAKIYLQLIESDLLKCHNWLNTSKYFPNLPPSYEACLGYSSVFDLQTSSLINYYNSFIGQPVLVKEIKFNEIIDSFCDKVFCSVPYVGRNTNFACVTWWELVMTDEKTDYISTAPKWIHNNETNYHWRDHWLQGVFSIRNFNIETSSNINFYFCHDSYSTWIEKENNSKKPFCTCGLHMHIPHNRLYQLNSPDYSFQIDCMTEFAQLKQVKYAIVISDLSYLSTSLSNANVMTHLIIDNDSVRKLMRELIDTNYQPSSQIKLTSLEEFSPIDNFQSYQNSVAIFGDPYFIYSNLPWDNLHFWYAAEVIRNQLPGVKSLMSPQKMCIKGLLVKFDKLHKTNKSVKNIVGFDMSPFNDIIKGDRNNEDLSFESKFLWEYDSVAQSEICDLITFDLTESIEDLFHENGPEFIGKCVFNGDNFSNVNGLVLWTTWELCDGLWLDNSLDSIDGRDGKITWKPVTKQAVHFIQDYEIRKSNQIGVKCVFHVESSSFNFSIVI